MGLGMVLENEWKQHNVIKYRNHNPSQAFLHHLPLQGQQGQGMSAMSRSSCTASNLTKMRTALGSNELSPLFWLLSSVFKSSKHVEFYKVEEYKFAALAQMFDGRHFPWSCPDFVCSNCAWFQSFTMRYWGSKTGFPCPNYFNPNDWPKTLKAIQRPAKQLLSLQGDLADWYAKQSYHN